MLTTSKRTALFQRSFIVTWTLWMLDGRWSNVVLGISSKSSYLNKWHRCLGIQWYTNIQMILGCFYILQELDCNCLTLVKRIRRCLDEEEGRKIKCISCIRLNAYYYIWFSCCCLIDNPGLIINPIACLG